MKVEKIENLLNNFKKREYLYIFLIIISIIFVFCSCNSKRSDNHKTEVKTVNDSGEDESGEDEPLENNGNSISLEYINNTIYELDGSDYKFTNGIYEIIEGTSYKVEIDKIARGHLNSDSLEDGVVLFSTFCPQTGETSYSIVAIIYRPEELFKTPNTFIGVRKKIKAITINKGTIILSGYANPYYTSDLIVTTCKLKKNELIKLSETFDEYVMERTEVPGLPHGVTSCIYGGTKCFWSTSYSYTDIVDITRLFGPPDKIQPFDNYTEALYEQYDLKFKCSKKGGFIEGITVNNDIFHTDKGIRVGSSKEEALKAYPNAVKSNINQDELSIPEEITFMFKNNRVISIYLTVKT